MQKSPLDLKNEGNAFFQKCQFTKALSCYSAGIDAMTKDVKDGNNLKATLYSNRSGCYYEMGDYENAIADAKACLQILNTNSDSPLILKNLYRLARALYFNDAPIPEIQKVLDQMEGKESEEYNAKVAEIREQLDYYSNLPDKNEKYRPFLLRSKLQDPYVEYYNFGQDESESLLQRNENNDAQSIFLDKLDDDELSSLAFLFGGVGDGRHVFATLLDANHQYQSLSEAKKNQFHLHLTLNDISAQLLAKDALVLVLAHELGVAADSAKEALTTAFPFNIGIVIEYATLGRVMPKCVFNNIVKYIKKWFTDSTREIFLGQFPWLVISKDTWDGIIKVFKCWIDPENTYSPKFPSSMSMLASHRPEGNTENEFMSRLSSMGASNDVLDNMKSRIDTRLEKTRAEVTEALESTGSLRDEMVDTARKALGDDATEEEMKDFWVDLLIKQMAEGDSILYVSALETFFFEETGCIFPAFGPSDDINMELSLFNGGKQIFSSKEHAEQEVDEYRPRIAKHWVANPAKICPTYFTYSDGYHDGDGVNPLKEWPGFFLPDQVKSFMTNPPEQVLSTNSDEENKRIDDGNSLASNVIRYYWNVGKAISNLQDNISVEVDLGSVVDIDNETTERETNHLPTKYHRITLSNIPDYTGMQIILIKLTPMLASKTKLITPCIQSNVLLNTGIWATYDDYVFSTTALPYQDLERLFRLKVPKDNPSVWDFFVVWEKELDETKEMFTHNDLRHWLQQLFLSIILPPDRDASSTVREERPSTMSLFLATLSHCVNHLGVPSHLISSILEALLKKKTILTRAVPSNDSPARYISEKDAQKKRYNLSAFHSELANQTAIWIQNEKLGLKLFETSRLPTRKASLYKLKLNGIPSGFSQSWSYESGNIWCINSLGFMLQKVHGECYDISTAASNGGNQNPMLMMMAMMQGGDLSRGLGGGKKPSKLRRDLLASGNQIGHVLSCMEWNLAEQTVSFWMCDDFFVKFSDYTFKLIRTDGWFCLPHSEVKLRDAKCMT